MGSFEGCALGLGEGPQIFTPTEKPAWPELFFGFGKMLTAGNMRPPTRKRQRLFRDSLATVAAARFYRNQRRNCYKVSSGVLQPECQRSPIAIANSPIRPKLSAPRLTYRPQGITY